MKFKGTIKRNAIGEEKLKIFFQFLVMLIFSVIGGYCLVKISQPLIRSELIDLMNLHFSAPFSGSVGVSFVSRAFFKICAVDLCAILLTLIFTFSFINYIVSDLIIVFIGLRLGIYGASLLIMPTDDVSRIDVIFFIALKIAVAIIIFVYSYRLASLSLKLRRFTDNGRLIVNRPVLISVGVCFTNVLGLVLLLNGLYCLLIYIK